jgi:hypothetical protein
MARAATYGAAACRRLVARETCETRETRALRCAVQNGHLIDNFRTGYLHSFAKLDRAQRKGTDRRSTPTVAGMPPPAAGRSAGGPMPIDVSPLFTPKNRHDHAAAAIVNLTPR